VAPPNIDLGKVKAFLSTVGAEYILAQILDGVVLSLFDLCTDDEFNQAINGDSNLWANTPNEWKALLGDDLLHNLALKYSERFTYEYIVALLAKKRPEKHKIILENPMGAAWLERQIRDLKANMETEIRIAQRL